MATAVLVPASVTSLESLQNGDSQTSGQQHKSSSKSHDEYGLAVNFCQTYHDSEF